jgi:hypothetical protein
MNSINKAYKMFNRRFDDIVIVINHEIKFIGINDLLIDEKKYIDLNQNIKFVNKIYVEYLNNFAEKFLGFKIDSDGRFILSKILNRKIMNLINQFLEEEEEYFLLNAKNSFQESKKINLINLFDNFDFVNFFRKINNFSIRDIFSNDQQVSIKIFSLSRDHLKNTINNYYYLIIRSLELETEFAKFKNRFFKNMNMLNKIDSYFDAYDMNASLNEMKMLLAFKKKFNSVNVIAGYIEINEIYNNDDILISSSIEMIQNKIRPDDFLGISNDNKKIIIYLFNCSYKNSEKVFQRLINNIKLNNYIMDKYQNNINDIFSFRLIEINENDDIEYLINTIFNSNNQTIYNLNIKKNNNFIL